MMTLGGVIEKDKNPFACETWIAQGLELTEARRKFLPALLGLDERTIRLKFSINDGTYIAFLAIRWGYANWIDGKLQASEKWLQETGQ